MHYFSQTDFQRFLADGFARLRLEWLALTGRIFTVRENEELRHHLEDFFRMQRQEETPGRKILEKFWEEDR
jgi:hypothetical protein